VNVVVINSTSVCSNLARPLCSNLSCLAVPSTCESTLNCLVLSCYDTIFSIDSSSEDSPIVSTTYVPKGFIIVDNNYKEKVSEYLDSDMEGVADSHRMSNKVAAPPESMITSNSLNLSDLVKSLFDNLNDPLISMVMVNFMQFLPCSRQQKWNLIPLLQAVLALHPLTWMLILKYVNNFGMVCLILFQQMQQKLPIGILEV